MLAITSLHKMVEYAMRTGKSASCVQASVQAEEEELLLLSYYTNAWHLFHRGEGKTREVAHTKLREFNDVDMQAVDADGENWELSRQWRDAITEEISFLESLL